jgi:hypothetical protein
LLLDAGQSREKETPVSLLIPAERQKELFSCAFVHAVAAVTRCSVEVIQVDVDSVDLEVKRPGTATRKMFASPIVDIQLKCTSRSELVKANDIAFPLPIKNYDDLREVKVLRPRLLVVVLVPPRTADWLTHSEQHLRLLKCGYYQSLRGLPRSQNKATVTVHVPRAQQFGVRALGRIMDYAAERRDAGGVALP